MYKNIHQFFQKTMLVVDVNIPLVKSNEASICHHRNKKTKPKHKRMSAEQNIKMAALSVAGS